MDTINKPTIVNKTAGCLDAFCGWYFGKIDGFLIVIITFIIVDYITGLLRAIVEKRLSSKVGQRELLRR